jgi:hypothetical protein
MCWVHKRHASNSQKVIKQKMQQFSLKNLHFTSAAGIPNAYLRRFHCARKADGRPFACEAAAGAGLFLQFEKIYTNSPAMVSYIVST